MAAEWAVRVAVHLLWEAYDNYRVCYVPPFLRWSMPRLDLYPSLGSEANVAEVCRILGFIDRIDCDRVPVANQPNGGASTSHRSPGRCSLSSSVFVCYDPYGGALIDERHDSALSNAPRTRPFGHPEGFVYAEEWEPLIDWDNPTIDDCANLPLGYCNKVRYDY